MTVRKIPHPAAKRRAKQRTRCGKFRTLRPRGLDGGGASGRQGGIATASRGPPHWMNISSPMKPRRLVSVLGIEIVSASSSVVLNSTRRAVVLRHDPVLAVCAHRHRSLRQSSSASRRTASHVGFLLLSQLAELRHVTKNPSPKVLLEGAVVGLDVARRRHMLAEELQLGRPCPQRGAGRPAGASAFTVAMLAPRPCSWR